MGNRPMTRSIRRGSAPNYDQTENANRGGIVEKTSLRRDEMQWRAPDAPWIQGTENPAIPAAERREGGNRTARRKPAKKTAPQRTC